MGATVDSSAHNFLKAQHPLRRWMRIAPNDLQHAEPPSPSGLATGLPHYREQVRSPVLCVTASVSGICKAGTAASSFYICPFDAVPGKKETVELSHVC